jgi:hypothetical protein
MGEGVRVRFEDELPSCCSANVLRLPRPDEAAIDVQGEFGRSESWFAGFDEWQVRVGVRWDEDDDALPTAVSQHLGTATGRLDSALAAHGVHVDDDGFARVGDQTLLVARLEGPPLGSRRVIQTGFDLWDAADELAGDLESLVGPLVADREDDSDMWGRDVTVAWPDAILTNAVLLLRSARVTPVLRGHLLGAWAAAQSIQLFDHSMSMVATKAAPLERRDAVRGLDPEHRELTLEQTELWNAEQERLTRHWHTHLGLVPLPDTPSVLTWHTAYKNPAIDRTLALWD